MALGGFAAVGLIVFSMIWNPPTGRVHDFTEQSNYSVKRDSGCVNSGKGCHGAETRYADFNTYHKDAKCTTCHDYQGVGCIPCHSPSNGHDCALCHDGTMKAAPDVVRLTDPYPRGHYRETSHSVEPAEMSRTVRSAAGGKAKAACKDCHAADLKKSHTAIRPAEKSTYGADIGCGECHNDEKTGAVRQVLSKWKSGKCEECHKAKGPVPVHDTRIAGKVDAKGPARCGDTGSGCHESNDLHAIHPDAPKKCSGPAKKGEPGCHAIGGPKQSVVPTQTACGEGGRGCHPKYLNDELSHVKDAEVHSPSSDVPGADTSYKGIPCGRCHLMAVDGRSLDDEHALVSSAKSEVPQDRCRNCHNADASKDVVAQGWPDSGNDDACAACHGKDGLDAEHQGDFDDLHSTSSAGCAESGAGCHPTSDLADIAKPTTTGGMHSTCLRCHDAKREGPNLAFDPSATTCGSGRDCHTSFEVRSSVHGRGSGHVDGADLAHVAGAGQAAARFYDAASGLSTSCSACHSMALGTEHSRVNASLSGSGNTCVRCHDRDAKTAGVVKANWRAKGTNAACSACHATTGTAAPHSGVDLVHTGRELSVTGSVSAGYCAKGGCHATADLRSLHHLTGCTAEGCHRSQGDIFGQKTRSCGGLDRNTSCHVGYSATSGHGKLTIKHAGTEIRPDGAIAAGYCAKSGCHTSADLGKVHGTDGCSLTGCHSGGLTPTSRSCGGVDASVACHTGFSPDQHFVSHDANRSGTVDGVAYATGANGGCFGCHWADLTVEHDPARTKGGAVTSCRVCHYDAADTGNGAYGNRTAVTGAIAANDLRCASCHKSGSDAITSAAVASPHKALSAVSTLPAGKVWSDPFGDWRAAFESVTGGGHNVLPAGLVGASSGKSFPVTTADVGGTTYTWSIVPNSGTSQWLDDLVYGSVTATSAIQALTVTCEDCHVLPAGMTGPHGSAAQVFIDAGYSQTQYADPDRTALASQFEAAGTQRVICFKCHTIGSGSVDGTTAPGGAGVHAAHARHRSFPAWNPRSYGDKCVDCHVRVPHAWKRPRLLVKTVGADADTFPYVSAGHRGLAGVLLRDIDDDYTESSCAVDGCHLGVGPADHPYPSDIPGASYWP